MLEKSEAKQVALALALALVYIPGDAACRFCRAGGLGANPKLCWLCGVSIVSMVQLLLLADSQLEGVADCSSSSAGVMWSNWVPNTSASVMLCRVARLGLLLRKEMVGDGAGGSKVVDDEWNDGDEEGGNAKSTKWWLVSRGG